MNVKLDRPGLSPPLNDAPQSDAYKTLDRATSSNKELFTAEEKKRHPHVFNCVRKALLWVGRISSSPSAHATRGDVYQTGLFGALPYLVCFKKQPVNWSREQWTKSNCVGRAPGIALPESEL